MKGSPIEATDATLARTRARDGIVLLSPDDLRLRACIEEAIATWITQFNAIEVEPPRLLRVDDLASIDYFHNFPHLPLLVATTGDADTLHRQSTPGQCAELNLPTQPATYALPSAGCYGLYFALRGQTVPDEGCYTLRAHCYRNEQEYIGLDRLRGFTMREVVSIGSHDHVSDFAARAKAVLVEGAAQLGISAALKTATDPFFDNQGSRALVQKLSDIKTELVTARGVALGSVNQHRNFFGERCHITLKGTKEPVYTACMGFGIERWVSAVQTATSDKDHQ
jgi:threonyl-tRNA synthetase